MSRIGIKIKRDLFKKVVDALKEEYQANLEPLVDIYKDIYIKWYDKHIKPEELTVCFQYLPNLDELHVEVPEQFRSGAFVTTPFLLTREEVGSRKLIKDISSGTWYPRISLVPEKEEQQRLLERQKVYEALEPELQEKIRGVEDALESVNTYKQLKEHYPVFYNMLPDDVRQRVETKRSRRKQEQPEKIDTKDVETLLAVHSLKKGL